MKTKYTWYKKEKAISRAVLWDYDQKDSLACSLVEIAGTPLVIVGCDITYNHLRNKEKHEHKTYVCANIAKVFLRSFVQATTFCLEQFTWTITHELQTSKADWPIGLQYRFYYIFTQTCSYRHLIS